MTPREATARAMAFFEGSDDIALLHQLISEVAPRAKRMVISYMEKGEEDAIPGPADLRAAKDPLIKADAVKCFRLTNDFALLQILAHLPREIALQGDEPRGVARDGVAVNAHAVRRVYLHGRPHFA